MSDSAATGHNDAHHKSIGEVLALLQDDFPDISISKIRFLESRGLIEPHRAPSGYRKFATADVERLRWILTMQRDHFLPLRVIKERLDEGSTDSLDVDNASGAAQGAADADEGVASTTSTVRKRKSRFTAVAASKGDMGPAELARVAGLSAQQLDQLVQFGLIDVRDDGNGPVFGSDEVRVAKAAAGFLQHGIEPRHLKAWRVAAEREAGMLEQIIVPILRKGSTESNIRAREVANDLVDMGNTIREAIIVKSLRDRLGSSSD